MASNFMHKTCPIFKCNGHVTLCSFETFLKTGLVFNGSSFRWSDFQMVEPNGSHFGLTIWKLDQTLANNSTEYQYSSKTCRLENNSCKYLWQISGHYLSIQVYTSISAFTIRASCLPDFIKHARILINSRLENESPVETLIRRYLNWTIRKQVEYHTCEASDLHCIKQQTMWEKPL